MSRDRGSRWTRWRVAGRLARRQVWRTKGSSALVVLLVMLPVLGLTAASVFFASTTPSRMQTANAVLGQSAAKLWIVGGADPTRRQAVDNPDDAPVAMNSKGTPVHTGGRVLADLASAVPAGTELIRVVENSSIQVKTAGGIGTVTATAGPVWDAAFRGAYVRVNGSAPTSATEAMATPGLLARVGASVGDTVELADRPGSFTITGTMRQANESADADHLFLPAAAGSLLSGAPAWYAPRWQPTYPQLTELNHAGAVAYARDLMLDPPPETTAYTDAQAQARLQLTLLIGGIAAAFCAYVVVLLAGAAFAVSARRQQRSLAVAACTGAGRSDVFRVVVLQGTVLGLSGGVMGAGLGAGLAAIAVTLTNDDVFTSFWWSDGVKIVWWQIAALVAFATVIGTAAAALPARAATRGDVLSALRDSRQPTRLNAKRPVWGVALMIGGIGATVAGALYLVAFNRSMSTDYNSLVRIAAQAGVITGPIFFQIGVIVAGHWILVVLSRGLGHTGLPGRIASRDAAAAPSRMVPAFGAIAACVFVASFALSLTALYDRANVAQYSWSAGEGSVAVTMYSGNRSEVERALPRLEAAIDATAPRHVAVVGTPTNFAVSSDGKLASPGEHIFQLMTRDPSCHVNCESGGVSGLAVVAPEDLQAVLGVPVPASALARFASGGMLVPWLGKGLTTATTEVSIDEWKADDLASVETAGNSAARPLRSIHPDLVRVNVGRQFQSVAFLTPDAAARIGIRTQPHTLIATYGTPIAQSALDRLNAAVADIPVDATGSSASVIHETGPQPLTPLLAIIVAATTLLVIAASAVCLSLARYERRPDDATLAGIGADRSVRRRVNAWQGLIVVGIGAVTGTIAGLIPLWGFATINSSLDFADTPWAWLCILAVGLPAVVAFASWIVPPRHPDLTRRTAIA